MKNPDRDRKHRRRRGTESPEHEVDGRDVAGALYGGLNSSEPTDEPMSNANLDRSKRHEREVVNEAEDAGLFAERAYASDGQSLGETKETDVLLQAPGRSVRVQCKRRKSIAQYLSTDDADIVVMREDRAENLAVVPLDLFLDLLQG